MKSFLLASVLIFAATSFADTPSNTIVRCTGLKADGVKIGLDVVLDPIDRLVSVTLFEREAVAPIELKALVAPSHFLKRDEYGNLLVFGLKTFNDGLIEDISVFHSIGRYDNSLQLSYLAKDKAVADISCKLLK